MIKYLLYGLGKSNLAVKKYFDYQNIEYIVYLDTMDLNKLNIKKNLIVIKSPGIKNDTPLMQKLIKEQIQILTDIGLFYELFKDIFYIGITGTLGKTSTTMLCHHLLKSKINDIEMAGNIGIPIFEYALRKPKYLIVELSSFELEYCGKFKPNIMLYLNCYAHHLNHHQDFKAYLHAKLKPIINMDQNDLVIYNNELKTYFDSLDSKCNLLSYSQNDLLPFEDINNQFFNYTYNLENLKGLMSILKYFNLTNNEILTLLNQFNPPTYRMEMIYQDTNLIIINDSKSTCLKSTIEGVKNCLSNYPEHNLILIMGGKIDLDELIFFKEELISIFNNIECYYYGENKELLNNIKQSIMGETLTDILDLLIINNKKQLILFSPGAQSLDQYSSFMARGQCFNQLIMKKIIIKN